MNNLRPDETVLIGIWIDIEGRVEGDETCKRIEKLIQSSLELVTSTDAGWTKLFMDKNDGRYWELTYPHGDWHGGGPPTLTNVSPEYVRAKY